MSSAYECSHLMYFAFHVQYIRHKITSLPALCSFPVSPSLHHLPHSALISASVTISTLLTDLFPSVNFIK